jgi:hypothetical protein
MLSRFFHQTEAADEEALNRAIPGARFNWIADSGPSFTARFQHVLLDGLVLTNLGLDQPSYTTLGERIPDFNIWHAIGPRGAMNGGAAGRAGAGAPGRGGTPAYRRAGMHPLLRAAPRHGRACARTGVATLPAGTATRRAMDTPVSARIILPGIKASWRSLPLTAHPALLDCAAARTGLHTPY